MKRSKYLVAIVFAIFFVLSFVTNILGPIIPDMIQSFHLNLFAAGLLPFAFFIAYGVFSIPAGFLVERWGGEAGHPGNVLRCTGGLASICGLHIYPVAMVSLFLIGSSMAALQVAINPLLRVAGGEEHFAFNSAFAQLIFGIASFISPQIYSYIVRNLEQAPGRNVFISTLAAIVPETMRWISMYWIFAIVIATMILLLAFSRFPQVERKADEAAGTAGMYRYLLKKPVVWLYFFSVFFYVGSEQGTANWMSEFLWKYHGFDPHTTGASAVGWFWGLMTVGCFAGMILLKLLDSRRVLGAFGIGALACLTIALFGPRGHRQDCVPVRGPVRLCDVADHHFSRAELGAGIPGSLGRDTVFGYHGRGHYAADRGPNCRLIWPAHGHVPALCNLRLGLRGLAVGKGPSLPTRSLARVSWRARRNRTPNP